MRKTHIFLYNFKNNYNIFITLQNKKKIVYKRRNSCCFGLYDDALTRIMQIFSCNKSLKKKKSLSIF